MSIDKKTEEIRWKVITLMLEEFPGLKVKLENYLKESNKKRRKSPESLQA